MSSESGISQTYPHKLSNEEIQELKTKLSKFHEDPNHKRSRNTPLAKLFGNITDTLGDYKSANNRIAYIYKRLPQENDAGDLSLFEKRSRVIKYLLDNILAIHRLSHENPNSQYISIPLYDMQVVEQMINIIVVDGVYSCLPDGVGIPLDKRRLKNFKTSMTIDKTDFKDGTRILDKIVSTMIIVFTGKSDLRNLIQVGSGFTDVLTSAIVLYTNLENSDVEKKKYNEKIKTLEDASSTYQLFSLYTLLMANSKSRTRYAFLMKQFVLSRLSELIVRRTKNGGNGLEAMIDVIMGLRTSDKVDMTRVQQVVRAIIVSKPKTMDYADYFHNICDQLFDILVHVNRPVMSTIAATVAESIFSKNQKIIVDFLFKRIWNDFDPRLDHTDDRIVLTGGTELNNAFNVTVSLSRKSASHTFLVAFFTPLILPLWGYLKNQKLQKKDYTIVEDTIASVLSLEGGPNFPLLKIILENLIWQHGNKWIYGESENKLTEIKELLEFDQPKSDKNSMKILDMMDSCLQTFDELLSILGDHDFKKTDFVVAFAFKKWLKLDDHYRHILVDDANPFEELMNLKLVQMLVDKYRDNIAMSPDGLIRIVTAVLETPETTGLDASKEKLSKLVDGGDSDDEDAEEEAHQHEETVGIALDILENVIHIISNSGEISEGTIIHLKHLQALVTTKYPEKSSLGKELKSMTSPDKSNMIRKSNMKKENERLLEKAMKSLNDPIPSVRVYGLKLIRDVAKSSSEIISMKFAVNIHINQLKDKEPFVYLNAIKGMEALLEMDASQILPLYIDFYTGKRMKNLTLDSQLRIGEVLLRFIQKSANIITDNDLDIIFNSLITLVGRKDKNEIDTDIRLRMSAMSIIGSLCHEIDVSSKVEPYIFDIVDLINGILTFERKKDQAVMRRAAIVCINDIIGAKDGLQLVGPYGEKIETNLKYVVEEDNDILVREQAREVLNSIDETFEETFNKSLNLHAQRRNDV